MRKPVTVDLEQSAVTISIQSLLDERHAVKDRTLTQPAGSGQWTGNFRGQRRGHGTDFDDLRHYSPGDELRHIDWKASARTNALHTRLYREERDHRVTLITDLRSTMFTGTRELRSVRASRLSARLLWQAIEGGSRIRIICVCDEGLSTSEYGTGHRAAIDACGLLARRFEYTQKKIDASKPGTLQDAAGQMSGKMSGQRPSTDVFPHHNASVDLSAQQPEPSDLVAHPDMLITLPANHMADTATQVSMEQVAHWLLAQRHLHGTILWISAFDSLGNCFNKAMETLSQATRQVAVHVNDAMLEHGLPTGHYAYRSSDLSNRGSQSITLSRPQCRQLHYHLSQQKQQRAARFSRLRIPLLNSDEGNSAIVAALRQNGYLP